MLLLAAGLWTPGTAQFAGSFNGSAGTDLSGSWSPLPHEESTGNPAIGEYYGVPITEGARAWGLAWDPSRLTLPEHQCQVHVAPYIFGGPLNLRIWEDKDAQSQTVIAIRQYISTYEQNRTIWMDGRRERASSLLIIWRGYMPARFSRVKSPVICRWRCQPSLSW